MTSAVRCREILKSARGNTLVGLLAGLAIMEISGTALVSAFSQFSNQQAQLDLKTSSQALTAEMVDEFSKLSTCTSAIDTTSTLQQDGDGSWPISMTVPDLPGTLLTSGSSRELKGYGLKVRRLYMDRMSDTGIKGPIFKQNLYTGNVIVQFESMTDGMIQMREQTVTQLFVEVQDGHIASCANGSDPTMALNSACNRVQGTFNPNDMTCDMGGLAEQIATTAFEDRKLYLDNEYRQYLLDSAQVRINNESRATYDRAYGYSKTLTDTNTAQLDNTIVANTTTANRAITAVNNTLTQNVTDLTRAINTANSITANAQAITNVAVPTTAAANQQIAEANAHSANAQNYANLANQVSNQANATSDSARNIASSANATANSANATSNYANSVSGTANYYSNTANNTSNAANSTTGWANSTASSANNYATSAFNASASANSYSDAAINTANASYGATNSANSTSNQANAWTNNANWWYQQWAGRQSYNTYSYNYTSRACTVGGPNCSWQ